MVFEKDSLTKSIANDYPILWELSAAADHRERFGGDVEPLMAEEGQVMHELWLARSQIEQARNALDKRADGLTVTKTLSELCCEVCGRNGEQVELTITFGMSVPPPNIVCGLCSGLIESGLIRPEGDGNGGTVYRQWHMGEWTPGELLA